MTVNIAKRMEAERQKRLAKPPIDVAPWFTCPLCSKSACHCSDLHRVEFFRALKERRELRNR